MEQTDLSIRTDQRTLLTAKLKRGQLFEESPLVRKALEIWTEAVNETSEIVKECRNQFDQEVAKVEAERNSRRSSHKVGIEDTSDEEDE